MLHIATSTISSNRIKSFTAGLRHHNNEGVIAVNQEQKETGPGIVVLSPSLQILHMNRQAFALLKPLERTEQNLDPDLFITALLHQHCHDILETSRNTSN